MKPQPLTGPMAAPPAANPVSCRVVEVAVPVPLAKRFHYAVPEGLELPLCRGMRVAVPFGGRKIIGVVTQVGEAAQFNRLWNEASGDKPRTLKELGGVVEHEPIFPEELFQFLCEAAEYYMHPLGEVFRTAAPVLPRASLRALKQSGFLTKVTDIKGARVSPTANRESTASEPGASRDTPPRLHPPQQDAVDQITAGMTGSMRPAPGSMPPAPGAMSPSHSPGESTSFLLHGVTGSGKTEVYLHVIARALEQGLGALVLVPEIALTPQLVAVFQQRFGRGIAVLHSALHDRARYDAWQALRAGEVRIALGARSAIFAPVQNLGVVIVDEEHDASFKQEDGFRYHGRDMALLRAKLAGAVCVLGSATPSLESYSRALEKKHVLISLPERATSHTLPSIQIVDLRTHRSGPSQHPLLTAPLHRAIEKCLQRQEQAILFLNRRGFSPTVQCKACGTLAECPSCSVTLTEHRRAQRMRCHYCDFSQPVDAPCAECKSVDKQVLGVGTERLEEALRETFDGIRVARLDRDTSERDGGEEVLDRFRRREFDVLVGTQMVTKGHDIPGVTFVGVMLADQSMGFPDFRAIERTFQLLSQVSGRAGRGEKPGEVIIQTYQPEHPVIRFAHAHDYEGFYKLESMARRELQYPPYGHLVAVRVDGPDEAKALGVASKLAALARRVAHPSGLEDAQLRVLGPAPAPIARLRSRYRFRVLLVATRRPAVRKVARALVDALREPTGLVRVAVDIDPVSML